jgi:UDP-N-acetylglucosamine 2-epimerase (non-hydrolysing)
MKLKKIDVIVGARPNFMKAAALFAVMDKFPFLKLRLIHTGQHYDAVMSDVFLKEFGLPKPVCHLGVGSGSHAEQTAEVMKGYEGWVQSNRPDMCIVVGDVNSTIACALVAAKSAIKVVHVEAGLRSFDKNMPEEINRILTDRISDLLFVTEQSGIENLMKEGCSKDSVHLVGHVMIDTLFRMKEKADKIESHKRFSVAKNEYAYITLHRPSNVDDILNLNQIADQLSWLANKVPLIFPVHPRTRINLKKHGLDYRLNHSGNIHLVDPVGYLESVSLMTNAKVVITDSGGLQEETTSLKIPCLTLRENTERPITITHGTNTLIGCDWKLFRDSVSHIMDGSYLKDVKEIPFWDGKAGERILEICQND